MYTFVEIHFEIFEYDIFLEANKGGNFTKRGPSPISTGQTLNCPPNAIIGTELCEK